MSERRLPDKNEIPDNYNKKKPVKKEKAEVEPKKEYKVRRREDGVLEREAKEVKHFVLDTVIFPTLKDMAYNIISGLGEMAMGAIESAIFGERRDTRSSTNLYRHSHRRGGKHTSYSSIYDTNRRRYERPHEEYKDVIFDERIDAEEFLEDLYNILEDEGSVTVGDVNRALKIAINYTDEDWGWESLTGARVRTLRRGGYSVELPRPKALR